MKINGVRIDDTFAEAFPMKATRLIITARNMDWAYNAARAATGFATSVIACGCEAGIERELKPKETPDGRPGLAILLFTMGGKDMGKQIQNRVGQCILTCPTTACYAGMADGEKVALGKNLRFFGDGWQIAKRFDRKRYWRVPVMDGEFLCEENTCMNKAIGGGNFLVLAETQEQALAACEKAIKAMRKVPEVVMPFPGGVVRSGSKIGSQYKSLPASTNDAFCPTLKGQVETKLTPDIGSVMEIVIDGLNEAAVKAATRAGVLAACSLGADRGIRRISAGNYGGNLGPFHFHLREIVK